MIRTHYFNEVTEDVFGKEVVLAGWASSVRVLGKIAFIKLRDRTGVSQVTIPSSNPFFELVKSITLESVLAVKGVVEKNEKSLTGWELIPSEIKVLNKAEVPLPLDISGKIESELETRLSNRFMDLRQEKVKSIFLIRDGVLTALRNYSEGRGFVEVHTPKIVGSGAEGGATLFEVDYFGKKAFLSQSPQLYKQELMATGFDKVYEIGNYFRAEKSDTSRHVAEFTMWDVEMAFIESQEDVMSFLEEAIVYVYDFVKKNYEKELSVLGVDLKVPKTPFPRISYSEAIDLLGKKKGDEIGSEDEKKLGKIMKEKGFDLFFITGFPEEEKPFYIMESGKGFSYSFDLEQEGQELTSGGQREHRYEVLVERMKKKGLKPESFKDYLQAFRFGMPPHGGFGLGVDRLVQKMLGINNIREVVLHPRDLKRIKP